MAEQKDNKKVEKTVEQRAQEAQERLGIIKSWNQNREPNEQSIYAQGLNGNLTAIAISGERIQTMSMLYDLLERVAEQSDVEFIPMLMGFLQIYHAKAERRSKKTAKPESKDDSENTNA